MPIQIASLGSSDDSQYPDFPLVKRNLQIAGSFVYTDFRVAVDFLSFCHNSRPGLAVMKIWISIFTYDGFDVMFKVMNNEAVFGLAVVI